MDLKELLGDDYKEGMTAEEIEAALADKEFVDPTTLPETVTKKVFDKTASELAKVKRELKTLQTDSMTDAEKLQEKLDAADESQRTYVKKLSELRAKEIFVKAGLTEAEYETILETVVSDDEETTKTRATAMVDLIDKQKKATEKILRAELMKKTPKPPAGEPGDGEMTKEKFAKMNLIEKQKFASENPDIYKEFYKEE